MDLLGQTILRAPDGTRWVVTTQAAAGGFVTTARKTGCDLRPLATTPTRGRAEAAAAHRRQCESIQLHGRPAAGDDPAPDR